MIISASRRTDIPAFYSQWFFERLASGHVEVANPYNSRQVRRVSLAMEDVDCIIFWTKNPAPLIARLDELDGYRCGIQFTLNDYGQEIEPLVPRLDARIDTFKELAARLGANAMTWRYDPIILCRGIDADYHIAAFAKIADQLAGSTTRVIISFVDYYRKISKFWNEFGVREPSELEIEHICRQMVAIAARNGMRVQSCAEKLNLENYGILPGACLDASWIASITGTVRALKRAKAQRGLCRCVESTDIGAYGTCRHACRYCYAT